MSDFPNPLRLLCLALCGLAPVVVAAAPGAAAKDASDTTTTVIDNPGRGTNRIEITGNTVQDVRGCPGGVANVNSVNIDGQSLKGRTIIVAGRNVRDVHAEKDCAGGKDGRPAGGASNVNSINIR